MRKEQERALATIADYQQLFNSEVGKRVLNDLVRIFLLSNPHVDKDPYATEFNAGAQSVVQTILKKLKFNVKKITELLQEQGEEEDV